MNACSERIQNYNAQLKWPFLLGDEKIKHVSEKHQNEMLQVTICLQKKSEAAAAMEISNGRRNKMPDTVGTKDFRDLN